MRAPKRSSIANRWTFRIVIVVNFTLMALWLNPWVPSFSDRAAVALVLEVALWIVVGLPVVLFQVFVRKKGLRQSVRDAFEAVMDFLSAVT